MDNQKQFDQITLGLWAFGIVGGAILGAILKPSENLFASILCTIAFCINLLILWHYYLHETDALENSSKLISRSAITVMFNLILVFMVLFVLDAILDFNNGPILVAIFLVFMVYVGQMAWQTVQHSLIKTLPMWLMGGLTAGIMAGQSTELTQDAMVKQTALIIVFCLIMGVGAMTGQLEAGVNSVLSTEPPSEGESAIH